MKRRGNLNSASAGERLGHGIEFFLRLLSLIGREDSLAVGLSRHVGVNVENVEVRCISGQTRRSDVRARTRMRKDEDEVEDEDGMNEDEDADGMRMRMRMRRRGGGGGGGGGSDDVMRMRMRSSRMRMRMRMRTG